KSFQNPADAVGQEYVGGLLLDDDLLCALEADFGIAIGNYDPLFQQGGFGLALPGGAGDAVGRPVGEFGIVLGVGVGGGDDGNATLGCQAIEARDGGNYSLCAGDVECSSGVEEIELGIDVDEDGFHRALRSAISDQQS